MLESPIYGFATVGATSILSWAAIGSAWPPCFGTGTIAIGASG